MTTVNEALVFGLSFYERNFKTLATLARRVNYKHNTLVVQATVATIVNYYCNMFTVQATDVVVHS
jgi:hypothetical protein